MTPVGSELNFAHFIYKYVLTISRAPKGCGVGVVLVWCWCEVGRGVEDSEAILEHCAFAFLTINFWRGGIALLLN